jgi:hypothetical protein
VKGNLKVKAGVRKRQARGFSLLVPQGFDVVEPSRLSSGPEVALASNDSQVVCSARAEAIESGVGARAGVVFLLPSLSPVRKPSFNSDAREVSLNRFYVSETAFVLKPDCSGLKTETRRTERPPRLGFECFERLST